MSTPDPREQPTKLDNIPATVVLAFLIVALCGLGVVGMVILGYAPATSLVLGLMLLACAFSILSGSPLALALVPMIGFFVVVSTMIAAGGLPAPPEPPPAHEAADTPADADTTEPPEPAWEAVPPSPEMRRAALVAAGILVVVMALVFTNFRWFLRPTPDTHRRQRGPAR